MSATFGIGRLTHFFLAFGNVRLGLALPEHEVDRIDVVLTDIETPERDDYEFDANAP